ncbi:hypothetical protein BUALT_Bualt06G0072000 [Buddleja alternifolia]|uniref:DUF7804 domain-containing protein n=1 Tax=Buddleja alternifolia TaxID=168488 RepID=A0AAV6XLS0_9LAMI|nr:hypothetical protein BUALT_Bualt06G0072000 [Buddleja alternifolia]
MASLGIHTGPKLLHPTFKNKSNLILSPNPLLPIPNNTKKISKHLISASIASSNPPIVINDDSDRNDVISFEKIDSWMQESVQDIVKNLKQAPLLVQIYSENETGGIKLRTEKAIIDDWPVLENDWRNGESKSPDGLIYVEELGKDCENLNEEFEEEDGVTKAWGICVQGKGVECGPSCYLLKTNRVCGGMGLGFCTHFCLMRVNNFRDSAFQQFKDSWLLK